MMNKTNKHIVTSSTAEEIQKRIKTTTEDKKIVTDILKKLKLIK